MGAIGGLLGLSGGVNGSGFAAPTGTNIQSPVTGQQADNAYLGTQNGLNSQAALLNALQGQDGLANQSNVYNQLQGVANGTGPNPAQAMLAQSTGQNVANQASLAAGQRGASSNVGLLARQAAQTGSNAQQQAAGQAATMQANQSLNALTSMGNMANTQAANEIGATQDLSQAQQSEQANLLNSIAGVNNANVSMQGNINSSNTSLANQLTQGQQGMIGGMMQGASSAMSSLAGGGQVQNFDDGGGVEVSPITTTPAPAPEPAASSGGGGGSSGGGGLSSLMGLVALMAQGGQVQYYADGTPPGGAAMQGSLSGMQAGLPDAPTQYVMPTTGGAQSAFGKFLTGVSSSLNSSTSNSANSGQSPTSTGAGALFQGASAIGSAVGNLFGAEGGKVPVKLTPQEKVLSPDKAKEFAKGGPLRSKTVPGKPKVPGKNDYANDTYSTELKPGTIIIPLESLHSNEDARKFVQATLSKRNKG
jgi:hypothetical protein